METREPSQTLRWSESPDTGTVITTALLWVDNPRRGLLFDGALTAASEGISPGNGAPGLGQQFKTQDAEAHRVA